MDQQDKGNPDCGQCGAPFCASGLGAGYGIRASDHMRICYACCGDNDRRDMIETGRAVLYLTSTRKAERPAGSLIRHVVYEVTNWPGSLRFKVQPGAVRSFRHPFARNAKIAYFTGPDGATWSAKNIGDSDIAHCRRIKG